MKTLRDLRILAKRPSFFKLLLARLASQTGDGLFQTGLAFLFFFQANSMADVTSVAVAFAVLLLPYSIVGPFTGPLLDRLRRRQVLFYGNIARFSLVILVMLIMMSAGEGILLYVVVLFSLGLSRFMLAGVSAGTPMVVGSPEQLLVANSIVPTLGGVATALGAACGFAMRLLLPQGVLQNYAALACSAVAYALAAVVATRLGKDELGPEVMPESLSLWATLARCARELGEALSYLARRGTPGAALGMMSWHRFVYGVELITIVLAGRNLLVDSTDADAGLSAFALLFGSMLVGHFVAVILTPLAHEVMEPWVWILVCLIGGTIGQMFIVASWHLLPFAIGMFIFGVGVQGAKIAVDTIVQRDTADEFRGRAFALYDVFFNVAECLAAVVCIFVLPDVGWSRPVQIALIVMVWLGTAIFAYINHRLGARPREVR